MSAHLIYRTINFTSEDWKQYMPIMYPNLHIVGVIWQEPKDVNSYGVIQVVTSDMSLYNMSYHYDSLSGYQINEICPTIAEAMLYELPQWEVINKEGCKIIIHRNIIGPFRKELNKNNGLCHNWAEKVLLLLSDPTNIERLQNVDIAIERFVDAHKQYYATALQEIRNGRKSSHWIWYIFPQFRGFGHSYRSTFYGIESIAEAKAFLEHPLLGQNLQEITEALLALREQDIHNVMGKIDAMKLRSSMTLFDIVSPDDIFGQVLNRYYQGSKCPLTIGKIMNEDYASSI